MSSLSNKVKQDLPSPECSESIKIDATQKAVEQKMFRQKYELVKIWNLLPRIRVQLEMWCDIHFIFSDVRMTNLISKMK